MISFIVVGYLNLTVIFSNCSEKNVNEDEKAKVEMVGAIEIVSVIFESRSLHMYF